MKRVSREVWVVMIERKIKHKKKSLLEIREEGLDTQPGIWGVYDSYYDAEAACRHATEDLNEQHTADCAVIIPCDIE